MFRPVRFFPSRPPSFESFTPNVIFKVGGSMGDAGSGSVTVTDATVSVTVARESPATETMSPAAADASGDRTPPCDVNSLGLGKKRSNVLYIAMYGQQSPALEVKQCVRIWESRNTYLGHAPGFAVAVAAVAHFHSLDPVPDRDSAARDSASHQPSHERVVLDH